MAVDAAREATHCIALSLHLSIHISLYAVSDNWLNCPVVDWHLPSPAKLPSGQLSVTHYASKTNAHFAFRCVRYTRESQKLWQIPWIRTYFKVIPGRVQVVLCSAVPNQNQYPSHLCDFHKIVSDSVLCLKNLQFLKAFYFQSLWSWWLLLMWVRDLDLSLSLHLFSVVKDIYIYINFYHVFCALDSFQLNTRSTFRLVSLDF